MHELCASISAFVEEYLRRYETVLPAPETHRPVTAPAAGRTTPGASRYVVLAAVVALLVVLSGCAQKVTYKDIADPNGLYHFKVRSNWQSTLLSGVNLVYASDKLPASDALADTLTLAVYASYEATDVPLPEQLQTVIERRAENRGWKSYQRSEATSVTVGGREGVAIDVTGVDANRTKFDARFYLVRAGNRQVGFLAVAPAGKLATFDDELKAIITERWFWHGALGGETTQTR